MSVCIFIDDIAKHVSVTGKGCHFGFTCLSIILYADDIILLAPSVTALQSLLDTYEDELYYWNMCINSSKFKCIRFVLDIKILVPILQLGMVR